MAEPHDHVLQLGRAGLLLLLLLLLVLLVLLLVLLLLLRLLLLLCADFNWGEQHSDNGLALAVAELPLKDFLQAFFS